MAVELCGARLLAPVFGSSLYIWASVLGITLIALAGGYFSGGHWSAKTSDPQKKLFTTLSFASLAVMVMPFIAEYLVPRIAFLSFFTAMLLSTLLLLFAPVFLLGASSPLFIALQSKSNKDAGQISGMVYAVSTFGGILATFICGFYFLPVFGLKLTLLSFGTLLFLLNAMLLRNFSFTHFIIGFGFVFLTLQSEFKNRDFLYKSEGIMGRVEVKDEKKEKATIRLLKVNDIVQSEMDLNSGESVSDYVGIFDSLATGYPAGSRALVLGLGAGLTSNLLVNKNFNVQAVEFDERVIYAAQKYFGLDKTVLTVHDDARHFINNLNGKFDVVLADIFKAEEQPSHVLTMESLSKLKTHLNKKSRLLINWHGYSSGALGRGTSILHQTLIKQGFDVKYCAYTADEAHRNLVIIASLEKLPLLAHEVHPVFDTLVEVNTDDRPLLEEANALANMAWRRSYLQYYTGQ